MSRKKSAEFKREARQFVLTPGLSRNQVAADPGIGLSTLNRWVAQHKDDDYKDGDLLSGPEDGFPKELARLRKENRIFGGGACDIQKGDGL